MNELFINNNRLLELTLAKPDMGLEIIVILTITLLFSKIFGSCHMKLSSPSIYLKNPCNRAKGELLFSSVELVNFGVGREFVLLVKCTVFCLNRGLSVYSDLYSPDFPNIFVAYGFVYHVEPISITVLVCCFFVIVTILQT